MHTPTSSAAGGGLLFLALVLLAGCPSSPRRTNGDGPVHEDRAGDVMPGLPYPGVAPGTARAILEPGRMGLSNRVLQVTWPYEPQGPIGPPMIVDRVTGEALEPGGEAFAIHLEGGEVLPASAFRVSATGARPSSIDPTDRRLEGSPRMVDRCGGERVQVTLADTEGRLEVELTAELRDGSNYVTTSLRLIADAGPVRVRRIDLFDFTTERAEAVGRVRGSPIFDGTIFIAAAHPMAENRAEHPATRVGEWTPETAPWPEKRGRSWDISDHVGEPGTYEVLFQYTRGGHRLEIHGAEVLSSGEVVARDDHFGATGSVDVDNRYRFELPEIPVLPHGSRDAELRILALSDGGPDSTGYVTIARMGGPRRARVGLDTDVTIEPGRTTALSGVMGVVPAGQRRRGFLYYVERERAHPYRPFLHYNSWYDIGFFSDYDDTDTVEVVRAYGEALVEKRGVTIDSFLFDDGWDDTDSLWDFHVGLPDGFAPAAAEAEKHGAAIGVWLSPWGGYGKPRERRLEAGKKAGYETNERGFALSAPKYYGRIEEVCLRMVKEYGANQFKFDGVGSHTGRYPGSRFGSDFEAALALIQRLRKARPDIYVNQTTGTWPSPFWLLHADSTWRGGYDHEFSGVGTKRQQWITYRDARTYENVVRAAPLYPISSLMLHGVIYARKARGLSDDPGDDLRDEIRTAFGCGTQLQELYVSPTLMTEQNWDDLAEAARWGRTNAQTLRDVHWIGGSPEAYEVYGWAAWSPGRGVITLRNPKDVAQTFALDVGAALELPGGAAGMAGAAAKAAGAAGAAGTGEAPGAPGAAGAGQAWVFVSPFEDQRVQRLEATAGEPVTVELRPWEVLVFEGKPAPAGP